MTSVDDVDPHKQIRLIPDRVNANPRLCHRGRFFTSDIMIEIGDTPYYLRINNGRIDDLSEGPVLMRPWAFAIRAGESAWTAFWQAMPAPGYHDIFAMTKFGAASIDGDFHPLMANLRYVKDLLATARAPEAGR